jgi:hypothetical protein
VNKQFKTGLLQAIAITAYISLVSLVMNNAERIFGKMDDVIGPVAFLTMFATSVLVCGLLVFKKPYELFFDEKKKEAINVVVYTAASLFVILLILFGIMFF